MVKIVAERCHFFDGEGTYLRDFIPQSPCAFGNPTAVCVDQEDNIIVADNLKNEITIFSPQGEVMQIVCL